MPPKYSRAAKGSKLDSFKPEIARLLDDDPDLPGVRVGELLEPLGWAGGKTILDDYLREVRPFFQTVRTTQRTIYRPGEVCQFDVWEPTREIPVGHGQTRKGYVVVVCLGYSRAGAGALIFTKQTPDLLAGIRRCLWKLGGLAETLVWDRQAGIHAYEGRPTQEFAAFCGQLSRGDGGLSQPKGLCRSPRTTHRTSDRTSRTSSTPGARRPTPASTARSVPGRSTASLKS